jgi:hypothetical protein
MRFFFDSERDRSPVSGRPRQKLTAPAHSAIHSVMTTTKLDFSGLKCPLPALKTRKALKELASGDRLEITCTDSVGGRRHSESRPHYRWFDRAY